MAMNNALQEYLAAIEQKSYPEKPPQQIELVQPCKLDSNKNITVLRRPSTARKGSSGFLCIETPRKFKSSIFRTFQDNFRCRLLRMEGFRDA